MQDPESIFTRLAHREAAATDILLGTAIICLLFALIALGGALDTREWSWPPATPGRHSVDAPEHL